MMNKVVVKVSYKDMEYVVEGDPEDVIRNIIKWLEGVIPTLDIAERLTVDVDYVKLSDILSKYKMVSRDGDIIYREDVPRKLSLSNKILLTLGTTKLLYNLGKRSIEGIYLHELSKNIGASSKTVSSRLSELYSSGYVDKDRTDEGILYKITIKGLLRILSMS